MKRIYYILLGAVLLAGCRKEAPEVLNPIDDPGQGWGSVFRSFWTGMNNNYVFWDMDPTDWDTVYNKYVPIFDTLSDTEDGLMQAYGYLSDMTSSLIDYHFQVMIEKDGTPLCSVDPSLNGIYKRTYYHPPLQFGHFDAVRQKNRSRGRIEYEQEAVSSDTSFYAFSYLIDQDIAYLRLNKFRLHEHLANPDTREAILNVLNSYDKLVNSYPNLKGVVIDTRSNSGGANVDLPIIAGSFVAQNHKFAETRTKSGLGRCDYSPWMPMYLHPLHSDPNFTPVGVPIVSLVDLWSVSMGEITAMAIRTLPNGKVVGERTYGATGPRMANIYYLCGPFKNTKLNVTTVSEATRDLQGVCYEGVGVPPDIEVLIDMEGMEQGVDNQLERAIQYIRTGR